MTKRGAWVFLVAISVSMGGIDQSSAAPTGDPIGHGHFASTNGSVYAQRTTLIDFNELTGKGNPDFGKFDSKGYHFQSEHAHIMLDPTGCSFGGCVSDGTIHIAQEDGGLGRPITMTRADRGKFCLKQFDGAENFLNDEDARDGGYPNATKILVLGLKPNGVEVTQSFTLDGEKDGDGGVQDFQAFTFSPKFKGLISATFYGNKRNNSGGMSFDNITVRA